MAPPSQKACEIVEEAAAEAGLIKDDTARLVKVPSHPPFMHALPQCCTFPHHVPTSVARTRHQRADTAF